MEWGAKRRRTGGNDGTAGGASSTHTSTEDQEVATSSGYDYEVFLSFRGPDTRAGFTDFLYTSLKDAGIHTFKDDEDLRKGVEFAPELLQAIKQSKILIPIFSKDYASSVWCLKEVVQMVECKKNGGKMIMPIFYDVAPSEVRYQIKNYEKSFLLHESKGRCDQKTIGEWRDALRQVGEINGWELPRDPTSRRESEFVKEFTQKIFNELKKASLAVTDNLVSVDHHVKEIMEKIGVQTSETRIIGIHGMGGIGKTTLAKIIYIQLLKKFNNCCFLVNIREQAETNNGILSLQKKLILEVLKKKPINIRDVDEGIQTIRKELSNKKVLVVLDDVDHKKHMDALVGNRDWFGKGSKLIITTRNKEVLKVPEVDDLCEVDLMDFDKSLQLFSKHAFRRDYPSDKDIHQAKRAIKIAGGLPLALEVMGSLLARIEKEKWDVKLKQLKEIPLEDVQSKLKISFDELKDREKVIFLDIACFLIGCNKDIIVHFWESKFYPKCAMDVLESMSLIKIEEGNKVWMHDQLRDLGREIVRQQSEMKIEKQIRVWDSNEALDLLRKHEEGRKEVEALSLKFDRERHFRFTYEGFKSLSNLRFLQVDSWAEYFDAEERLFWHESPSSVLPTNVFLENSNLLPQLRWLSWHDIPPTFKITNFYMEDVVILDLSNSKITHDWQGWSHMKVMKNLKVLNLGFCYGLERSPNFSAHSNLERLILYNCGNLVEIDESICQLKCLVSLDVEGCHKLRRLPKVVGRDLASLIELNISFTKIKELPDSIGNWENLKVLNMIGTPIRKIPDALWMIKNLEKIEFEAEHDFKVEICDCIYKNQCLRILNLGDVRIYKVPRLPESLINLDLHTLYMDTFPDLSNLVNLKELTLWFGRGNDGGESGGPVEAYPMPRESLNPCSDYVTTLPADLSSIHPRLKSLKLKGADLRCLPPLPSTLSTLYFDSKDVTTLPTDVISLLPQLKKLLLRCPYLRCLPSLPSSLSSLQIVSECVAALPTDMSSLLPRLQKLSLHCPILPCLPNVPLSLSELRLKDCKSLSSLGDLSNLKGLSSLYIVDCAILEIRSLDLLENLEELWLEKLQQVKTLPSIGNCNNLGLLCVCKCGNLVKIQGELPQSLETLTILECGSLKELPDLSCLKGLKRVRIKCCGNLDVEAISSLCREMSVKFGEEDSDDEYESEQEEDEFEFESEVESD